MAERPRLASEFVTEAEDRMTPGRHSIGTHRDLRGLLEAGVVRLSLTQSSELETVSANLEMNGNSDAPSMTVSHFEGFGTAAIHAGCNPDNWKDAQVVPPISLSTTYKQPEPAEPVSFDYTRGGNPTRKALETCLAALEAADYAHAFASGLAATTAIICSMLKTGDHIICADDGYGGTQRYFRKVVVNHGVETTMTDCTDLEGIKAAIRGNTTMLWLETPTNPLLKVSDIATVCKVAKEVKPDIIVIVDNTFMSPYNQRPLDLGADIVVHSITKYINGHSDVLMGCTMTRNKEHAEKLTFAQLAMGFPSAPFDCFLAMRGIKTLHVRMRQHEANGLAVAEFLEAHPGIEKVLHPGLPSHPQHAIHKKQARGHSGMLSFYHKGGLEESRVLLKSMKLFALAESLGGYESLAEIPSIMTHASVPAEERAKLGITDNLIRLSVGLEEGPDLIADLDQALKKALKA